MRTFAFLLACTAASFASQANAQESTPTPAALATRRELIRQAEEARGRGDFQRAIELGESAGRIQMTASLRLFLAQQQNSAGRYAEAYGNADTCQRESAQAARNQQAILESCQALVNEIRPRIGQLVVRVEPQATRTAADFRVEVAGAPIDRTLLGLPYVVTPGSIQVRVHASGFLDQERTVSVQAQQTQELTFTMEVDPASVRRTDPVIPPPPPVVVEPPPPPRIGPWVLLGVGGGLAAVGGVLFLPSHLSAEANCPENMCFLQEDIDRVVMFDWIASVTLGVGLTAAAGGLIWALAAPPPRRQTAGARASIGFRRFPTAMIQW